MKGFVHNDDNDGDVNSDIYAGDTTNTSCYNQFLGLKGLRYFGQ